MFTPADVEAIAQALALALAKEWFGPDDAATYLDLSATYLAKLRGLDAGPAYHQVGRRCLYRKADLDQWVASHTRLAGGRHAA